MQDTSYVRRGRTYGVRAVDTLGFESVERTLRLPEISAAPVPASRIDRGVIGALRFVVTSPEAVSRALEPK